MERLARTPSILLEIIQLSDISTLLNLRLADRAIWCLISTYEASISTAIAEHSFPNHHLRVRPQNHPKPTVKWLLELRRREVLARRLSAVSVEKGNGWICWGALLYILTYVKHMMFTFLLAMLRTSTALQEILQRQRERQLRFTLHPRWFDLAGSYTNVGTYILRHVGPESYPGFVADPNSLRPGGLGYTNGVSSRSLTVETLFNASKPTPPLKRGSLR